MAETHGQDTGPGINPASPPPAAKSAIWTSAGIIAIFLVLSAVAGYFFDVYLEKNNSAYTTSGKVRIVQLPQPGTVQPVEADPASLDIEKNTAALRFRSEVLVDDILKDQDNPIRSTSWWNITCGKDPDKAHELLSENLEVDPIPGSALIRISCTTPNAADTAVLITAVVDRAIQDQREFIRNKYDADRKRIADLKNRYDIERIQAEDDIKNEEKELAQLGANPVGQGSASENGGVASPKDTEINAQVNERVRLQAAKLDIDDDVAEMLKIKEQGQVPPQVQQMIDEDHDVINAKDTLNNISMRLADAQGDPKSTAFDQLTKTQELEQKKLDDLKAQKLTQYLDAYSAQMMASKKTINAKIAYCNTEIAQLEAELAEIANKTLALKSREQDEGVYRQRVIEYDKTLAELDQLMRNDDVGGMVWFERPRAPTSRIFPNLGIIMTTAVVLGLAPGVGIALLRALLKWSRRL